MAGIKPCPVQITARDVKLLRALVSLRILDRNQVKAIANFGATARVNMRLAKLRRARLIRRWFVGTQSGRKALYGIAPKGAAVIGAKDYRLLQWPQDSLITWSQFVDHQLALNSIFIQVAYGFLPTTYTCQRWTSFSSPLSAAAPLIPDGYVEIKGEDGVVAAFVEVDRGTETSKVWQRKITEYLQLALSGEFKRIFHQDRFRVLVAAPSDRRIKNLRKLVSRQTAKLFWFTTLDRINQVGLWSPIWLRPVGEQSHSLL